MLKCVASIIQTKVLMNVRVVCTLSKCKQVLQCACLKHILLFISYTDTYYDV